MQNKSINPVFVQDIYMLIDSLHSSVWNIMIRTSVEYSSSHLIIPVKVIRQSEFNLTYIVDTASQMLSTANNRTHLSKIPIKRKQNTWNPWESGRERLPLSGRPDYLFLSYQEFCGSVSRGYVEKHEVMYKIEYPALLAISPEQQLHNKDEVH